MRGKEATANRIADSDEHFDRADGLLSAINYFDDPSRSIWDWRSKEFIKVSLGLKETLLEFVEGSELERHVKDWRAVRGEGI